MAKYNAPASNLRGNPYIIFDAVLFRNHNPELSVTGRAQALFNIFSQVYGAHGEGDYKEEINNIWVEFQALTKKYPQSIEGVQYASSMMSEFILELHALQLNLDRLINKLEILKDAGTGDVGFIEY